MAQPMQTGQIVEVTLRGTHVNQRVLTILHYRVQLAPGTFPDFRVAWPVLVSEQLLATGHLVDEYLNSVGMGYSLTSIRGQLIHPVRFAFIDSPQGGASGLVVGGELPPNDSAFLVKRNDATGRHNRGGVHMPALPESYVDAGNLTLAARTQYNLFGIEVCRELVITSGGGEVTFEPVIFNRAQPANSTEALTCQAELTTRIMRRRTVGVGI